MAGTYAFWFRQKYSLTPNDPRFLAMTLEDIEAEYWAYHFTENPASESSDDEDFETSEVEKLMESDDWMEVINVGENRS